MTLFVLPTNTIVWMNTIMVIGPIPLSCCGLSLYNKEDKYAQAACHLARNQARTPIVN